MKNHHCLLLPLGLILVLIGAVTLVMFGIANLEPYGYTRDFQESECTVLSSNITTSHTCNHLDPSDEDQVIYSSKHPCLHVRVHVNYTEKNVGERGVDTYIYESYDTLVNTKAYNITCAIHICKEDTDDNEKDVQEFQKSYGEEGKSYKCYYNPINNEEVFVNIVTSSHILHALLWPGLALGFGLFMLVVVIFSSCEVWICMPWRNKRDTHGPGAAHHHHHHDHKHSYELATVQYGQNHEEVKSTYKA